MFIRGLKDCQEFIAGDGSRLREILHAKKGDFSFAYSLAYALVEPARATKPHKLKTSEVYYILEGQGIMFIDDKSLRVSKDDTIYIPPNSSQYIKNITNSNLVFLCIVDPAWQPEDEEILD